MIYKRYLLANTILVAIILWIFQIITPETSIYTIAILSFIFGIILSAQFTGMNSLAFADITEDDLSASTSITSTVQVLTNTGSRSCCYFIAVLFIFSNQAIQLSNTTFHQAFFVMGIPLLSSLILLS